MHAKLGAAKRVLAALFRASVIRPRLRPLLRDFYEGVLSLPRSLVSSPFRCQHLHNLIISASFLSLADDATPRLLMSQSRPLQRINPERRGEIRNCTGRKGCLKPFQPKASIISIKAFKEILCFRAFVISSSIAERTTLRSEGRASRGSESSGNGEWRVRERETLETAMETI